mgnify:CR=1 FL=1
MNMTDIDKLAVFDRLAHWYDRVKYMHMVYDRKTGEVIYNSPVGREVQTFIYDHDESAR